MFCCGSVAQSYPILCSMPGFPVLHHLPRAWSNSYPLNQWCHPTTSSCHPLLLLPSIFPSIRVFSVSQLFAPGGQSIGASASTSVLPVNIQGWFSCCPKGSQEYSPASQFESINSSALSLLYSSTLTSIHDYWKNHNLDYTELCQQSDVSAF